MYNPFPKYRKIPSNGKLSDAEKSIDDMLAQTNPWHTWWEGFFPFLLCIFCIVGGFFLAVLIGAEPLSFMTGSIVTLIVVALYRDGKKRKGD